jgi:N6-L-threonylcarbamoyladenine synthase
MAKSSKENYHLPTPKVDGKYDFSFSGLKTAVSQLIAREEKAGRPIIKEDVAYAFQETALKSMIGKTLQAVQDLHPAMVVTAGGVAANSRLRVLLEEGMKQFPKVELSQPPIKFCTDNAAMIGASGYIAYKHGLFGTFDVAADPGLMMPGEE